jgi:hypothetical protein
MTKIRITHRTVLEPENKYPIKSIVVYPGGMYLNFREKRSALDMFKKIKLASKGTPGSHYKRFFIKVEIYVDPIIFFKKAAGTLMVASRDLEDAAELLHNSISRKSYRNLLAALQKRSWISPARWPYDSKEDFERLNENVITHYFKKSYP